MSTLSLFLRGDILFQNIQIFIHLETNFSSLVDDDYVLFDCPGQIELYTHVPMMRQLVDILQRWDFKVCGMFLAESLHFFYYFF
jgi:GTPase SAR1 family protein